MDLHTNRTKPVLFTVLLLLLLSDVVLGGRLPGSSVFRPVLGFLLLTVIPGYVLASLLGLDDRSPGRIVVYAVGLSLTLVVLVSIGLNIVLGLFGADRPLSPVSVTVAVSTLILGLSAVRYVRGMERPTSPGRQLSLSVHDGIAIAVVSCIPVASILITVFRNTPGVDVLLIVLLCSISIVPILLWRWQGSPVIAPYAIWAVSAAVLFQMTLVSGHLWGFDIHFEYFTAAEIYHNGYWDLTRQTPSTSLVTVTLLGAVYSMVTGLELVWVYKFVYPLLVSLLPLGIWYITRNTFEDRSIATLAPFVLVFYYGFFKDMPDKQLVAGLFAVFLLVVVLDEALSAIQRWVLGLAFAVSLTVSHYGVSLLFVAFLGGGFLARYGLERVQSVDIRARITRPRVVFVVGAFWVVWYLLTASGVNFYRVVGVGAQLIDALPFPTAERTGAAYATTGFESVYWMIYKFLYIGLVGLIGLGMLRGLYAVCTDRDDPRSDEYTLLSGVVFCFLVSSVIVTFGMGFDRTLQIALFVVSPFAIVGARTVVSVVSHLASHLPQDGLRDRIDGVPINGLFAVFLAVLFLFSSGTVFAVGGEQVPPYNINVDEDAGWPVYTQNEVEATRWLADHTDRTDTVAVYNEWQHIKSRDGLLVSEVMPAGELEPIWLERTTLNDSAYVYVSEKPMQKLDSDSEYIDVRQTPFYEQTLSTAEVVYENENVTIYYVSNE